jgi:hypothetical protein
MKNPIIIIIVFLLSSLNYAQTYSVPELMYFKMKNNSPTTTTNFASSPVGINPAPYSGTFMTNGGQFDSCIRGTGNSGSNGILPGWNCNLNNGPWTISFWIKDLAEVNAGDPIYLFGDPGSSSFRCFYGGYALPNYCILRGPFPDIIMPCPMPGSYVFHIVYNDTALTIYRNGLYLTSVVATLNLPTGTGFRIAGYTGGTNSLNGTGRMDEFRMYNRALNSFEVSVTWNRELPYIVGIFGNNNLLPSEYVLYQNYPNPFNPNTVISYSIPKASFVRINILDMLGRHIHTLVNNFKQAGNYEIDFDGSNLGSGIYFYKLETEDFVDTKKMILLK